MNYTTDSIETYGVYYNIPQAHIQNPDKSRFLCFLEIIIILLIILLREPRQNPAQVQNNQHAE